MSLSSSSSGSTDIEKGAMMRGGGGGGVQRMAMKKDTLFCCLPTAAEMVITWSNAPCTAPALPGAGAGRPLLDEAAHVRGRRVRVLLHAAGVDHVGAVLDRDGRLCDVGCDHDLRRRQAAKQQPEASAAL